MINLSVIIKTNPSWNNEKYSMLSEDDKTDTIIENSDFQYINIVSISGYKAHGIEREDIIDLASDNGGEFIRQPGKLSFVFYTIEGGSDSVEIDNFRMNLKIWTGDNIRYTQTEAREK